MKKIITKIIKLLLPHSNGIMVIVRSANWETETKEVWLWSFCIEGDKEIMVDFDKRKIELFTKRKTT